MSKQQDDFRKVNKVLMDVLKMACIYLARHDLMLKEYCLQTAAWDGVEKLLALERECELKNPFLPPVVECLRFCLEARHRMPEINIRYPEYPVAAERLAGLASRMDQILEADPPLRDGIANDDLASCAKFANLLRAISQIKEAIAARQLGSAQESSTMTYGEFVDAMREVAKTVRHAEVLFDEWYNLLTADEWVDFRKLPLRQADAQNFVDDMIALFQRLISGTCTDALYAKRVSDGHAFQRAVYLKCAELGFQVNVEVPLSASDALVMASQANPAPKD